MQKDHPRVLQRCQRRRQLLPLHRPEMRHHMADVAFLIVVNGHHPGRAQFLKAVITKLEALAQPLIVDHRRRQPALGKTATLALLITRPGNQNHRVDQGNPQINLQGTQRVERRFIDQRPTRVSFDQRPQATDQQKQQANPSQHGEDHIDHYQKGPLASPDDFHLMTSSSSSPIGLMPRSGLTQRARF